MRSVIATALLALLQVAAHSAEPWQETSRVVAVVSQKSVRSAVAAVDAALLPLGYKRDPSADQHPGNLIPGLLATYVAGTYALASLHEGSGGCLKLLIANYDRARTGSAEAARTSVEKYLRESLGSAVRFYSDVECQHAL
jgi:hypothetical protein